MMAWIRGWIATIHKYLYDRETYDWLANARHDETDYGEVDRPG